jgi:hypothetical protein
VFSDGILESFEGSLFAGFRGGGIGELEDVLRELEVGVLGKLGVTHGEMLYKGYGEEERMRGCWGDGDGVVVLMLELASLPSVTIPWRGNTAYHFDWYCGVP